MQPWFTVYFFDIGHPSYDQLTPVKTRYTLTSTTWPYRGLKFTAHRDQVFLWNWLRTKCWFSIGSRAHVWLIWWKQGRIVRKPANASPGLKVNRIITFSSDTNVFAALFCVYVDYWNSKQKAKQYTENLSAKLQNSNKNSTFSLIGLWTTRPRSYAFRLAQIHILLFLSWWFWWNLSNKRTQAWRCFVKVILSTLCKRTLIFRQVLQEIIQFLPKIKNK